MENDVLIADLRAENAALKAELTEVRGKLDWLLEQLSSNRRKLFGASSEKSAYENGDVQIGIFEDDIPPEFSPVEQEIEPTAKLSKNRPKKHGELSSRLPANLPIETVECKLPEDQRDCPNGHGPMHIIGKEVARREFKIIPAKAVVTEYIRYTYSCRICEKNSDGSVLIIKADLPPQVIKGSLCAPETVAHIAVQKCVMGSPLYRQEQEWNRIGIPIKRQTMANWLIRCSEDYLEPIYDELHLRLCRHSFLHSDGTTFQVLREPGKTPQSQSCMWVYRTSGDAAHPIVLYEYQPDKKQERANEFLKGFSGYLVTDGASSYRGLPDGVILVGCFAHVRRRFFDALKVIKNEEDRKGSMALIGKQYCDSLFDIEREIKDLPFEERHTIRNGKSAPILNEFHAWLLSVHPYIAPKSKIGIAVNYAVNQWMFLQRYILDGRIEISNNRCERSVKPFVINRKNFLFSESVSGAIATAVFHSLTETAKESGLNPHDYLSHIFRTAVGVNLRMNADLVEALLPENAPESCRVMN